MSHTVSHSQENRLYRDRRIGLNPHSMSDRRLRGRHPRRETRPPVQQKPPAKYSPNYAKQQPYNHYETLLQYTVGKRKKSLSKSQTLSQTHYTLHHQTPSMHPERERDRERERERKKDRERHREGETQTQRERVRERKRDFFDFSKHFIYI